MEIDAPRRGARSLDHVVVGLEAAPLSPAVAIDAVIARLDGGQPDLDDAAARILGVLTAIVRLAQLR